MCQGEETRILSKTILKKNSVGGISLTDYNIYYIAMIIKTLCYWQSKKCLGPWNRIVKNPELDQCKYAKLIFDKDAQHSIVLK